MQHGNEAPHYAINTHPQFSVDPKTLFRVASLSKMVTARVVWQALRRMGLDPSTPIDASEILGFHLRNPHHPDRLITVQTLVGHTAGLRDLTVPSDIALQDFCKGDVFLDHAPNETFVYSNFGYVLLADIAERLTAEPFDQLTNQVLADLHVDGGFNWFGVKNRNNTLPTFRLDGQDFVAQVDESIPQGDPKRALNPAGFAPQGGLRTSLSGMLALAQSLKTMDQTRLWTPQMGRFDSLGGVFESYGWGVQIFDRPAFFPRPLMGHFGNAYGFNGGAWYDPAVDMSFAYALNGVAMGDESDNFSEAELSIFRTIAQMS